VKLRLTLFRYKPPSFAYENGDKRNLVSLKNNLIKEDGLTQVSFPLVTLKWTFLGGCIVVRQ